MGDEIVPIFHDGKIFEARGDRLFQIAEYDPRTAEPEPVDMLEKIGPQRDRIFMGEKAERRAVRIARKHDVFDAPLPDRRRKIGLDLLKDAQKSAMDEPNFPSLSIGPCGKIQIVSPILFSVALFEEEIEGVPLPLDPKRRRVFQLDILAL